MPKICKSRKRLVVAQLLMITMFSLFGLISFGRDVLADSGAVATGSSPATSTVNVNLADGITIRVLDSTVTADLTDLTFDLTPTDAGVATTRNAVVEVATSNETGYTLYMQSDWREDNTSSADLGSATSADFTTDLVHSGATDTPAVSDRIPSSLSGTFPYWYYTNAFDGADKVIPAQGNPDILAVTAAAADSSLTTVPVTVGVDTSVVSGTYRNKLVFTAVGNPLPVEYSVIYDLNGGTGVENEDFATMTETKVASADSFSLSAENPYYHGYKFEGWLDMDDEETVYAAGDTVTLIADNANLSTDQVKTKTLRAIWSEIKFWSISTMQEMTPEICASVYTPANVTGSAVNLVSDLDSYTASKDGTADVPQYTLSDVRDGNTYTVRKLADGECWMVENLRLGVYSGNPIVASTDSGSSFYFTPSSSTMGYTQYSGGYWYYSWYVATAGTGNAGTPIFTSVNGSICPAGWKLPFAYWPNWNGYAEHYQKSFAQLLGAYGATWASDYRLIIDSSLLEAIPISFIHIGRRRESAASDYGYYWSATVYGDNAGITGYGAYMSWHPTAGNWIGANPKDAGLPIRCVAL